MKNLVLVMALVLMASVVGAYEVEGNPDRKISLGFTFDRNSVSGDYESPLFKVSDAGELTWNHIKGDIRIPVASFLTLNLGGGYSMDKLRLTLLKDDKYDMKGYNLTAGFRIYIP